MTTKTASKNICKNCFHWTKSLKSNTGTCYESFDSSNENWVDLLVVTKSNHSCEKFQRDESLTALLELCSKSA